MTNSSFLLFLHISAIFMLCLRFSSAAVEEDRKIYIAYLGSLPDGVYSPTSHHVSLLQTLFKQSSVENYLTRSYRRSFNGFAAKLTEEEAKKLASFKGVVSVFPNEVYHLQTTRSWDFMGFNQTAKRNATGESNVIIGVLDTGIWPDSDSFNDEGFGPPPKKWKGSCNGGQNFTCNNKLIGARVYTSDSARDTQGHGTHTASTAAGNYVGNASFYGLAEGNARGGVPSARIAAYKVCGAGGCSTENILAGFDDAIADGVDLLTVSLGGLSASMFYLDPIAIGAFHAAEKGILVVQSAGNNGPGKKTVGSVAPWILSVAASTTDRLFIDKIVLGNGKTLTGLSINSFSLNRTKVPLVYGLQASTVCDESSAQACLTDCLNHTLVKNKIVLCDDIKGLEEAHDAGALGSIAKTSFRNISFIVPLPASALSTEDYASIKSYHKSTKQPVADILKSETIVDSWAPVVAQFSSRGPNGIVPDLLKPDISAPGVNILAAYSPVVPPSSTEADERRVKYNIMSGTSMACPHVAGVAAYVKTFHPDWSPSAIKSALITTAFPMDPSKNSDAEFGYGSGHVNPVKAINPGLVYDNAEGDKIKFLCSIGYSEDNIRAISGTKTSCPKNSSKTLPRDFNYPTLTAAVTEDKSFTVSFQRTVTNVGVATSTYNATITSESKLEVKVTPQVLTFTTLKEKKSYNVTVSGKDLGRNSMLSASLTWSDGIHNVRSPIVIHTYKHFTRSV